MREQITKVVTGRKRVLTLQKLSEQAKSFLSLLPIFFVLKILSPFMSAAYIQVQFRLDFIMKSTLNPDQTGS